MKPPVTNAAKKRAICKTKKLKKRSMGSQRKEMKLMARIEMPVKISSSGGESHSGVLSKLR